MLYLPTLDFPYSAIGILQEYLKKFEISLKIISNLEFHIR